MSVKPQIVFVSEILKSSISKILTFPGETFRILTVPVVLILAGGVFYAYGDGEGVSAASGAAILSALISASFLWSRHTLSRSLDGVGDAAGASFGGSLVIFTLRYIAVGAITMVGLGSIATPVSMLAYMLQVDPFAVLILVQILSALTWGVITFRTAPFLASATAGPRISLKGSLKATEGRTGEGVALGVAMMAFSIVTGLLGQAVSDLTGGGASEGGQIMISDIFSVLLMGGSVIVLSGILVEIHLRFGLAAGKGDSANLAE